MVYIALMNSNDSLYQNHMYNQVVSTIRCGMYIILSIMKFISQAITCQITVYYDQFIFINYVSEN